MNSSYTPEQKARRERGLCIDCGKAVDAPKRHVRCQDCRARMAAQRASQSAAQPIIAPTAAPIIAPIIELTADPITKPISPQRKLTPYEISQRREVGNPEGFQVCGEAADRRRQNQGFWRGAAAHERTQAKRNRCEACAYITFAGADTWFCPLAVCLQEEP